MEGNQNCRSDPHSDFVVEFLYGARQFKYLIAALTVGIFDDIEYIGKGEWVTDTALAHYRGYDVDNTRRLMNTLAAMKLLDRGKSVRGYGHGLPYSMINVHCCVSIFLAKGCEDERTYRNTICVTRYLLRSSQNSLVSLLYLEETLMPIFLKNLPYVLKHGSVEQFPRLLWKGGYPQDDAFLKLPDFAVSARLEYNNRPSHHHSQLQPAIQGQQANCADLPLGARTLCHTEQKSMLQLGRELFMDAWDARQTACLSSLLEIFDLRKYKSIVDLGGGSGRLAWHIIQAHPHIYMTVFDTPRIIESINQPFCINQNLKFLSGDFFNALLPEADCYIVSHVLHEYDDERVDILLGRISEHLNQGGVLLILEKVLQDDKRAPLSCILDDLLTATLSRGRERTEREYRRLLERNGFRYLHFKRILGVNTFDAMLARKPCEPCK